MARRKKEEDEQSVERCDTSHAFADNTGRFAVDALLRAHGFKIHARPRKGPDIWTKGSTPYTYEEALETVPADQVRQAEGEWIGYISDKAA